MVSSEGHVHKFVFEDPWGKPVSIGICACEATTEGRNQLSPQEAEALLAWNGKRSKGKPMTASPPPPAITPSNDQHSALPLEFSMNDIYISSFGFKVPPEHQESTVDRIEFSGNPAEVKHLQDQIKAGEIIITLRFKSG